MEMKIKEKTTQEVMMRAAIVKGAALNDSAVNDGNPQLLSLLTFKMYQVITVIFSFYTFFFFFARRPQLVTFAMWM